MLNIPEGATITATNESSRSFICGGQMILPHVPVEIDARLARVIDSSPYGSYFSFEFSHPDKDTGAGDTA